MSRPQRAQPILPLSRTLYGKLARLIALLLLVMSGLQLLLFYYCWTQAATELFVRRDSDAARELVDRMQPHLESGAPTNSFRELQLITHEFSAIREGIEVFLIGADGSIVADLGEIEPVAVSSIPRRELAELAEAGSGQSGPNPRNPLVRVPFSIAPLSIHGEPGFVYVTLAGNKRSTMLALLEEDAAFRLGTMMSMGIVLSAILVGLVSVRLITARFRAIVRSLRSFVEGNRAERVPVDTDDELGEVGKAINTMVDAIAAQVDALEGKDRLRRELIMNVWHDLRGPITSIRGHLELLRDREERYDAAKRRSLYETMEGSAELLSRLLSELHELARLEARESAPVLSRSELRPLLLDLIDAFEPRAATARVTLKLAEMQESVEALCDEAMVARVVQNLIENAIRHTPAGGAVTVSAEPAGPDLVAISVADTGVGIPDDKQQLIFERSYQTGGTEMRGAAGLGLAIAKRIVEAHGGQILVLSCAGAGTTFRFTLPRWNTMDTSLTTPVQSSAPDAERHPANGL